MLLAASYIPVADATDTVYDVARDMLYIPTGAGNVERYHVATDTLLAPVTIGVAVSDADITPDGRFLYVGERTSARLHRVDLETLTVTTNDFSAINPGDGNGVLSVAIARNGKGMLSVFNKAYGENSLKQFDVNTGIVSRVDAPELFYSLAYVTTSPDRSLLAIGTADFYQRRSAIYYADRDAFELLPAVAKKGCISIDRHNAQIGLDGVFFDMAGNLLGHAPYNYEFEWEPSTYDPTRDRYYVWNNRRLYGYDSLSRAHLFTSDMELTIGDQPGNADTLTVDPTGSRVYAIAAEAIAVFDLGDRPTITNLPNLTMHPEQTVGVTMTYAGLDAIADYAGTLTVTSSDPLAILPEPFDLFAASRGRADFTISFATPGWQTLTVTASTGESATSGVYYDPLQPTISIDLGDVTVSQGGAQAFTATFSDDHGLGNMVDASFTFRLITPDGVEIRTATKRITSLTDTVATVLCTYTPPGGGWDRTDKQGTYAVRFDGVIGDAAGNRTYEQPVGTFDVSFPTGGADLVATGLRVPPGEATSGKAVRMRFQLMNDGDAPFSGTVPLRISLANIAAATDDVNPPGVVSVSQRRVTLRPGAARWFSADLTAPLANFGVQYEAIVEIDADRTLAEISPANNVLRSDSFWATPLPFDIRMSLRRTLPSVQAGQQFEVQVTITNRRRLPAKGDLSFHLVPDSRSGTERLTQTPTTLTLASGERRTIRLTLLVPAQQPVGRYRLMALYRPYSSAPFDEFVSKLVPLRVK